MFELVNSSIPRGYDCKSQDCSLSSNLQLRTVCGVAIYSQFPQRESEREENEKRIFEYQVGAFNGLDWPQENHSEVDGTQLRPHVSPFAVAHLFFTI